MNEELLGALRKYISNGDYKNAFDCVVHIYNDAEDKRQARKMVVAFRQSLKEVIGQNYDVAENYELLHQAYLLCAKESFDDFMVALEWYRPVDERFWTVRREQLLNVCTQLEALANDEVDELFLSMPPRVGKLLADSTPVLTKDGWKNHGDLQVGDYVYAPNGKAVKVTRVFPKHHTTHTVTFTDGTQIKCHENHEWVVYDRRFRKERTLETKDMIGHLDNSEQFPVGQRGHRYHFQLPLVEPIKGDKHPLPMPPYTLGAWLGDGTNTKPRLTGDARDYDIIERVMKDGYNYHHIYRYDMSGSASNYDFETKLRTDLQKCGMCYSRHSVPKHIPEEYFTATIKERLELLAGLLDTDGTLARKEKRYQFTTSEESLRDDFIRLVSTFGWRVCVMEHQPRVSSSGVVGKHPYWVVSFNPTMFIPCVLERKQLREFSKQRKVAVKSIEPSDEEQGNCISVEGGVYRVGDHLIPTHNSTIVMFFLIWWMCKHPELPNLYASYTEKVVKTFFNGVLEVFTDPVTYDLYTIFPNAKIASTDSKDLLLNIKRKKRYPNLTARSVDGSLNGSADVNGGVLIADDLHSGIDEARSKDQMITKWSTVQNNLLSRKANKILWIGTHWSIIDCISNRIELLETSPEAKHIRYKVFNVPALNGDDESNFDYMFHKGFTTDDYKAIRASFLLKDDSASWLAQYMGTPIERDGAVFAPTDLRYYNGELPVDVEPDRIFMAVDPAWGGGDYVAAPLVYQYGEDLYIADVVYDNGDKTVTEPKIVNLAKNHNVAAMYVEATLTTKGYMDELDERFRREGYRLNIQRTTKHWTGTGKAQRIFDKAPEIRERMVFLDVPHRSKEYTMFMQNVFSFTVEGKNKHDDAPDSLAMVIAVTRQTPSKVVVMQRMF